MSQSSRTIIFCFGELLWDCLPQGLFPGGAPINVAYHLNKLGCHSIPVTAVGDDFLGHELMRRFDNWNLSRGGISYHNDKRTGAVLIHVDSQGIPSYEILDDVAWDEIKITEEVKALASSASAVVFGSLAMRHVPNLKTWESLLHLCPNAVKVFDVNLRTPYDDLQRAGAMARQTDIIKLNDEELERFMPESCHNEALEEQARTLTDQARCERICVTAGARGAGLLWDGIWSWENTIPVQVVDTIGAGDSFLAAFLSAWLKDGLEPSECLRKACRLSEFVASKVSATPSYQINDHGELRQP